MSPFKAHPPCALPPSLLTRDNAIRVRGRASRHAQEAMKTLHPPVLVDEHESGQVFGVQLFVVPTPEDAGSEQLQGTVKALGVQLRVSGGNTASITGSQDHDRFTLVVVQPDAPQVTPATSMVGVNNALWIDDLEDELDHGFSGPLLDVAHVQLARRAVVSAEKPVLPHVPASLELGLSNFDLSNLHDPISSTDVLVLSPPPKLTHLITPFLKAHSLIKGHFKIVYGHVSCVHV